MSTTTILELRQEDAHELIQLPNGTFQNGQYTTTLTHPITLEDGDQVSVKSVYLDTSAGTSGYIEMPDTKTVSIQAMMYLTNFNKDQTYVYQAGTGAGTAQQLRVYGNGDTPTYGDNQKYILGEAVTTSAETFTIDSMNVTPKHPLSRTSYCGGAFVFQYTGIKPGDPPYGEVKTIIVKKYESLRITAENPYAVNIVCAGSGGQPQIKLDYNKSLLVHVAEVTYNIETNPAGQVVIQPQLFNLEFDIPGGDGVVYSPLELSQFITDKVQNAEQGGAASDDYSAAAPAVAGGTDNGMENYPVMSPFITTVLKNHEELRIKSATEIQQIFIHPSGKYYFTYDIARMLGERDPPLIGGGTYARPALDCYVGTNQLALIYDDIEDKLKWETTHFPIYAGDTVNAGKSGNDAKPAVVYNFPSFGGNLLSADEALIKQYSGIAFTQLSPPDFWSDILGFETLTVNTNLGTVKMNYPTPTDVPTSNNSCAITLTEGVNITGALAGLDVGVVKSTVGQGYSQPIFQPPTAPFPRTYQNTDDVTSIFSTRSWNSALADEGYFLIDVGTNFQQNLVAGDLTSNNTQSIVNRYYTASSFTSDQGAGSIIYTHKGTPQILSSFRVNVLNPDRSSVSSHMLQNKNTVFMEVIKPITPSK